MKSVRNIGIMLFAVTVVGSCAFAADSGGLSGKDIEKIRGSFEMDAHTRAMYNSITNNSISSLALNRDIVREHNELFSHKIAANKNHLNKV